MNTRGAVRKYWVTGASLALFIGALGLIAPATASASTTTSCAGQYVFGPLHLESIASRAGTSPLFLGNHLGEAVVYPADGKPTQEWSGYRDANCALVIYNGTSDEVLTAATGADCYPGYTDCLILAPFFEGDQYQEWSRDVFGRTWVIHLLATVDDGKAIGDPGGLDASSQPAVLTARHVTQAAQQWQS